MTSGSRPFIFPLIQFFILKVRYPSAEVETSPRIEFPRATNAVWKSSDHMSANKTLLVELLKGCSNYFDSGH
jgi:hypothetical protein